MASISIVVPFYSLTLDDIIPFIKNFCPNKNTKIAGIVVITAHAISCPHSIVSLKLPLKDASATGKVLMLSEFVTIKGHMKPFQVVINVNIARVAIAGSANGNAILKNI